MSLPILIFLILQYVNKKGYRWASPTHSQFYMYFDKLTNKGLKDSLQTSKLASNAINLYGLLCLTEQIVSSAVHILELESNSIVLSCEISLHSRLDDRPSTLTTVQDYEITHSLRLAITYQLSRSRILLARNLINRYSCWEMLVC